MLTAEPGLVCLTTGTFFKTTLFVGVELELTPHQSTAHPVPYRVAQFCWAQYQVPERFTVTEPSALSVSVPLMVEGFATFAEAKGAATAKLVSAIRVTTIVRDKTLNVILDKPCDFFISYSFGQNFGGKTQWSSSEETPGRPIYNPNPSVSHRQSQV